MSAVLKMALRNLGRHRKRSVLTGMMIGVGALMMVLIMAFSQSVAEKTTASIVQNYTGDLEIHAPVRGEIQVFMAAADDTPLLPGADRILTVARRHRDVREAVPRLRFQGLLSNGDNSMGITAIGIDPRREPRVTPKIKVLAGSYLKSGNGILFGKEVASYFNAKINEEFVIVTVTPDGYTNGITVKLQGIVSAEGMEAFFDDNLILMDIAAVRKLLYLNKQEVSEVVVALQKGAGAADVMPGLRRQYGRAGLHVRLDKWQDVAGMLSGVQMAGVMLPQMSLVILLIVVALGITNTILMAVLERTRDIGTMLALGAKRREILGLFVAESALLSAMAAALGCLAGAGIVYYFSRVGIAAPFQALEFIFGGKRLYFSFAWPDFIMAFLGIIFFSAMVTILPARMALRLNPVDALRQS